MAVVVVMDQKGDTKELLKKYDIVDQHLQSRPQPPEGMIAHFCLQTPYGIRVSNVWESEARAQEGFKDPLLQEAFTKAEMPLVEPQIFPVHNYFITSELKVRV